MPTIVIIGASSGIGLRAVEAALAAGHRVRALARSAPTMSMSDARLEKIGGDARDASVIGPALDGADAVIQVLGVPITPATVSRERHFSRRQRVCSSTRCAALRCAA